MVAGGLFFSWSATPMHQRFNAWSNDFWLRAGHWQQIVKLMDDGWRAKFFGEGLGTLPRLFNSRAAGAALSEYRFAAQDGKPYLQLSGGDPLYFEQIVDLQDHASYHLRIVARNRSSASEVYLSLCQKWMFYSRRCQWYRVRLKQSADWQNVTFEINGTALQSERRFFPPVIKLSLANYQDGSTVDVASLALVDEGNRDLLRNGDFSDGSRHWFFSTDNHLPWHYKNLFLQIYFEQGLVGLSLFLAVLLYSAKLLIRAWKQGSAAPYPAPLLGAALAGFLVVGVVDSLFDFPRMSMLFYLLIMIVQCQKRPVTSLNCAAFAKCPQIS